MRKNEYQRLAIILVADDDAEDCMLIQYAADLSNIRNGLCFVADGDELIEYLKKNNKTRSQAGLIFLDLNMPRKDGFEALEEIRADPNFRYIPVVILSTSGRTEDISKAYRLGANGYIRKPSQLADLTEAFETASKYWLEVIEPQG